jgi:hypothetical protein
MSAAASSSCVPTVETRRFQRRGDYYEVDYAGHRENLKGCVGLGYLQHLLENPFKDIPVLQLIHGEVSNQSEKDGSSFAFRSGLNITDLTERSEGIEERLRAVRNYEAECRCNGDLDGIHRAEEVIHELEKTDKEGGPVAKALQTKVPLAKAKEAVRKAINRAINEIKKHCPPLARHLRRSISGGNRYSYEPEYQQEWNL